MGKFSSLVVCRCLQIKNRDDLVLAVCLHWNESLFLLKLACYRFVFMCYYVYPISLEKSIHGEVKNELCVTCPVIKLCLTKVLIRFFNGHRPKWKWCRNSLMKSYLVVLIKNKSNTSFIFIFQKCTKTKTQRAIN